MPTDLGGFFIFAALLVPGFIHYVQRRSRIPQRSLSPLVETATLATVSIFTNLFAAGAFGALRTLLPSHTPDVRRLFLDGSSYAVPRLGYLLAWGAVFLAVSSGLAFLLGARPGFVGKISLRFTPAIVDVSAWYHAFEEGPEGAAVYVGCDLRDGSYVAGFLDWYSTEIAETSDRDLVLTEPITFRPAGGKGAPLGEFTRLIISAREITHLYVSYLTTPSEQQV